MRLALAQINAVVGDIDGNRARIAGLEEARSRAAWYLPRARGHGLPPEDALLRPGFVRAARASLDEIATATGGLTALVGTPLFDRDLFNVRGLRRGER